MIDLREKFLIPCSKFFLTEEEIQDTHQFISTHKSYFNNPDFCQSIINQVRLEKTLPQICAKQALLNTNVQFFTEAQKLLNFYSEKKTELKRQLDVILPVFEQYDVPAMLIKGLAIETFYPKNQNRLWHDIDLYFPNMRTAWKALLALHNIGSPVPRLSLRRFINQELGGIASDFSHYGYSSKFNIDCHLGVYPIMSSKVYESDIWRRGEIVCNDKNRLFVPSPEDSLMLLCAHIYHDSHLRLRDINDAFSLTRNLHSKIDWDYVIDTIQKNNLSPIFYELLKITQKTYGNSMMTDEIMHAIRPKKRARVIAESVVTRKKSSLFWSFALAFMHTFPYERQHLGFQTGFFETFSGCLFEIIETPARSSNNRLLRLFGRILNVIFGRPRKKTHLDRYRYLYLVPAITQDQESSLSLKEINTKSVCAIAKQMGVNIRRITSDLLVWECPSKIELILTPIGIYTRHNRYLKGYLTAEKEMIEKEARALVHLLTEKDEFQAFQGAPYRSHIGKRS